MFKLTAEYNTIRLLLSYCISVIYMHLNLFLTFTHSPFNPIYFAHPHRVVALVLWQRLPVKDVPP